MGKKQPAESPSAHLQALRIQLAEAREAAAHAQREATVLSRQVMTESIGAAMSHEKKVKAAAGAAVGPF